MVFKAHTACFEHSNFFKVNDLELQVPHPEGQNPLDRHSIKSSNEHPEGEGPGDQCKRLALTSLPKPRNPTTSFLTATALIYATGAGITAAAGTRLALQWFLVKGFRLYSFQLQVPLEPVLLFVVTTSACRQWVICAPAAFLGSGSRFSSSLSGIKP